MGLTFQFFWWFFIFKIVFGTMHLPEKLMDVNNFNEMKSKMINEILNKDLSSENCRMADEMMTMRNLYFHIKDEEWSLRVQDLQAGFVDCFQPHKLDNDVFANRIELSVKFPILKIYGDFECTEYSEKTVSWNSERYDYRLRLDIVDLSGSGICFTRWTETDYEVLDCDLNFIRPEEKNQSKIYIVNTLHGSDPGLSAYLKSETFKNVLIEKLWRSLSLDLNSNVRSTINKLLSRENVVKYLRDPEVFQKYKNYVIESTQSANEFVDGIMGSVKKILNERFKDRIKIPDTSEVFEKKILLLTWRGSFKATNGTVRGLASVTRSGDTEFASDNASQTHFFGNLHFEQLDLHYDHYKAEFMRIGPSGMLSTKLKPIKLHIHPYVNFQTGKIYLEDFKIEDVGDLVIEITGLGTIFNWLVSKIATWIAGLTRDKILDDLQKKYDEYIKSILSGYTIDDITSGKAFDRPIGQYRS